VLFAIFFFAYILSSSPFSILPIHNFPPPTTMSPSNSEKRPCESETQSDSKLIRLDKTTENASTTTTTAPAPVEEPATMTTRLGKLLVKKLSDKARIPTRGSKHAAGFDLYR
jgi:dUTP pyrophosphatase